MASIKEEIAAIAADHGYTGPKPKSTAGAIDALADTLAGTDVKSGRSIAGAIHALAPYIGSGGGGAALGELRSVYFDKSSAEQFDDSLIFNASLQEFDISGSSVKVIEANILENANLQDAKNFDNGGMAGYTVSSGMYICARAGLPSSAVAYDLSSLKVYVNPDDDPQLVTDGYECNVVTDSYGTHSVYVTAQVPANGIKFEF